MSVLEQRLQTLKEIIPIAKQESAADTLRFVQDTLRLLRMMANYFYGRPVAEDIDEEYQRYLERWG